MLFTISIADRETCEPQKNVYRCSLFTVSMVLVAKDPKHMLSNTLQFDRSMTGGRTSAAIDEFWNHCYSLEEWRSHPCLNDLSVPRSRT